MLEARRSLLPRRSSECSLDGWLLAPHLGKRIAEIASIVEEICRVLLENSGRFVGHHQNCR